MRRLVVSPYDERWPEVYAAERARVEELMPPSLPTTLTHIKGAKRRRLRTFWPKLKRGIVESRMVSGGAISSSARP